MTPRTAHRAALGLVVAASLALGGCSGDSVDDGSQAASPTRTPSPTESATPYLPVPEGVELTPPGTHIKVGDQAVVAYRPDQKRVGVLAITVTALEETTIKRSFGAWKLTKEQRDSTPYFVRTTVENVGESGLGGQRVPLYGVNDDNVLLESTPFASAFEPCPDAELPKRFPPGADAEACLVYLAPDGGELDAVSFRPEETFDPITWTGHVERYRPAKEKPKNGKKGGAAKQD